MVDWICFDDDKLHYLFCHRILLVDDIISGSEYLGDMNR